MNSTFTTITRRDGKWWIGWIEEIPGVNAQEPTREKLLASLREILVEALEFNREEAPVPYETAQAGMFFQNVHVCRLFFTFVSDPC